MARDGSPIGRAAVMAAGFDGTTLATTEASVDGRYRLTIPAGRSFIHLSVKAPRFQPFSTTVAVRTDSVEQRVPDVVLVPQPQVLPTVRTFVERQRPERNDGTPNPGPGERSIALDQGLAFTGDLSGDPAWALAALPGVQVSRATDGSAPTISIAGLDASLNRTTMNGALAPGAPPRDAAILQVILNSYDPTVASGSLVTNWVLPSASFIPVRFLHATLTTPETQRTSAAGNELGARTLAPILSGNIAGPGKGIVRMFNASFQTSAQQGTVASLLSATRASLAPLGLASDSLEALRSRLVAAGLGTQDAQIRRRALQASGYARIDFTANAPTVRLGNDDGSASTAAGSRPGDVLAIILGSSVGRTSGQGTSGSALPIAARGSDRTAGTIQSEWSHFTGWKALSTARLALSANRIHATAASSLPAASVLIASTEPNGMNSGIASLGGSGAPSFTQETWLASGIETLRWNSQNNNHEFKLSLEGNAERLGTTREPGAGAFTFRSLADYVNDVPSAFMRNLDGGHGLISAARAAIGLGDTYQVSPVLSVQYGLRVEHERLSTSAPGSRTLDSLIGRDGRALPNWTSVSPMAGFTLALKRDARGRPLFSHALRGGVRDYRGSLPLATVAARSSLGAQGAGANTLRCTGSATPIPDWSGYLAGSTAIPTACAEGAAGPLIQRALDADVFAPNYRIGHSWRGDLAFDRPLAGSLSATLHGMVARNSAQPMSVDLNFDGLERGRLPFEGGRALFASAAAIASSSGAVSASESRRAASLGAVREQQSVGQSRAQSIGVTLAHRPQYSYYASGVRLPFSIDYTLTDIRAQENGFGGTTAGDPRTVDWVENTFSRHTLLARGTLRMPGVGLAAIGVQLRSPVAFAPLVSSDINGDGLANDRAFLFDPASSAAAGVRGLDALLQRASAATRNCLTSRIGTIARPNACSGSWSSTVDAALTLDSDRLGLQNRGAVRLVFSNLAAGADLLLHGAPNPRGWGQAAYPDPVLYFVRGYDAAASRFLYEANPHFGSSSATRAAFASPFRVALDISLEVGPSREGRAMEQRLGAVRSDTVSNADIRSRLLLPVPRLFDDVVRWADSLALTSAQVDSLNAWSAEHLRHRDSVYTDLANYLAAQRGKYATRAVQQRWHDAIASVRWAEWSYGDRLRAVLRAEQVELLRRPSGPTAIRLWLLDRSEAARVISRWFLVPA